MSSNNESNTTNKFIGGYDEENDTWRCVGCGIDMGSCNPRQYCCKTYCPKEYISDDEPEENKADNSSNESDIDNNSDDNIVDNNNDKIVDKTEVNRENNKKRKIDSINKSDKRLKIFYTHDGVGIEY